MPWHRYWALPGTSLACEKPSHTELPGRVRGHVPQHRPRIQEGLQAKSFVQTGEGIDHINIRLIVAGQDHGVLEAGDEKPSKTMRALLDCLIERQSSWGWSGFSLEPFFSYL
jgi:hypothetical protein